MHAFTFASRYHPVAFSRRAGSRRSPSTVFGIHGDVDRYMGAKRPDTADPQARDENKIARRGINVPRHRALRRLSTLDSSPRVPTSDYRGTRAFPSFPPPLFPAWLMPVVRRNSRCSAFLRILNLLTPLPQVLQRGRFKGSLSPVARL